MREIKNVCVIGAGVMGRQIALNAVVSGFQTVIADSVPSVLSDARTWCQEFMQKGVAKGKYKEQDATQALEKMTFVEEISLAVKNADLIIEAIVEKEDIKRELFAKVNQYAPQEAIITSNSSFIPSSTFADGIINPARLANLHYFNPAMHMKLVEIVKGPHTSDETIEILKTFILKNGKIFIIINKEIEGFVVNRLLRAVQNEAFFLLENGVASFADIDIGAEKGLNYPMGPFRLLDLTGLDICYYNRQRKFEKTGKPEDKPPAFLVEKFKKGEYGKKAGKGWYDYCEK